jgi:hypothetical protein
MTLKQMPHNGVFWKFPGQTELAVSRKGPDATRGDVHLR